MTLSRLCLAVLFAAVTLPAVADSGRHHGPNPLSTLDTTGVYDLGIDVTTAGSTPANVSAFLDTLPPRIRESLIAACEDRVHNPAGHQPSIVSFCETVVSL